MLEVIIGRHRWNYRDAFFIVEKNSAGQFCRRLFFVGITMIFMYFLTEAEGLRAAMLLKLVTSKSAARIAARSDYTLNTKGPFL